VDWRAPLRNQGDPTFMSWKRLPIVHRRAGIWRICLGSASRLIGQIICKKKRQNFRSLTPEILESKAAARLDAIDLERANCRLELSSDLATQDASFGTTGGNALKKTRRFCK